MKAVVAHNFRDFRYQEWPKPAPGAGEVLVRVGASGICAADRKIFTGNAPWSGLPFPFVPGHEFVGTVADLGEGAAEKHGLSIGQKVIAELNISCRRCYFCQRGLYHLCDAMQAIGGSRDGGWAEYMIYPAESVIHLVPAELPDEVAVYAEPLANAIHGVEVGNVQFADLVVIAGGGAIGMGMLQAARLKNPHRIIILDTQAAVRKLALDLGADLALDPLDPDQVRQQVLSMTAGRGCDVYFEASGAVASAELGFELLRKAGRMVVFGVYSRKASIDLNLISEFKELTILGGHLAPYTYPLAIDFLSKGLVNASKIVTHVYPLEDFREALELESTPDRARIKVIFKP